ncbi:hypothetical protein BgiMline_024813 [Biomphalaria glabrata]|nr:hypothetical protein BgiMline_007993 [Biomphalaria glabrata]
MSGSHVRQVPDVTPAVLHIHHQDGLFQNSFQTKSNYIIHPQWISEAKTNRQPEPLVRRPWPWEQPRFKTDYQMFVNSEKVISSSGGPRERNEISNYRQRVPDVSSPASPPYFVRNPLMNERIQTNVTFYF